MRRSSLRLLRRLYIFAPAFHDSVHSIFAQVNADESHADTVGKPGSDVGRPEDYGTAYSSECKLGPIVLRQFRKNL
jgi:hypothetical protein